MTEPQIEALYIWLEQTYPHAGDPDLDGIHRVGEREEIGRWRDGLLRDLAGRGTADAVAVLDRLARRFPELIWMKAMRARAAETARRAEWVPPAPAVVLAMAQDRTRRWITSDQALQTAVIDVLDLYAERLGGRDPQAADLWDTTARRPKPEQEIARIIGRFLKDRLEGRGVFLAREPEVRPSRSGTGRGESIDIWIEAVTGPEAASAERATVVIELKGCWNAELMTAMNYQLADRYLDPPVHRHGIQLVACFGTEPWSSEGDSTRYRRAARHSVDQLRRDLRIQAESLNHVAVEAIVLDCSLPPANGPAWSTPNGPDRS